MAVLHYCLLYFVRKKEKEKKKADTRETGLPGDTLTERPLSTTTVSRTQGTHHYTSSTVQPQYLLIEK